MTPSIPVIVYVVLQFVAFFFVLVGTPIDMFRSSNSSGCAIISILVYGGAFMLGLFAVLLLFAPIWCRLRALVLAWILDVINIILLLLPYDGVDAGANRKAELPTAQE
ncbi:putative integral membrane protein [Leishmania donovani]|uniref:Putative integral membrane protein n=1 Tax=Leishmania donovani TaxID=5661 RepID=A0A504XV62_LEIDO|nr:putative integral membrane protein [Leishmania donovani]